MYFNKIFINDKKNLIKYYITHKRDISHDYIISEIKKKFMMYN